MKKNKSPKPGKQFKKSEQLLRPDVAYHNPDGTVTILEYKNPVNQVKRFAANLKALRKSKKLTLAKVQEMTGISNAYLSQIEQGKRAFPTIKILYPLSKVYGVSIPYLHGAQFRKGIAPLNKGDILWTNVDNSKIKKFVNSYEKLSAAGQAQLETYARFLLSHEMAHNAMNAKKKNKK